MVFRHESSQLQFQLIVINKALFNMYSYFQFRTHCALAVPVISVSKAAIKAIIVAVGMIVFIMTVAITNQGTIASYGFNYERTTRISVYRELKCRSE